MEYRRFLDQLTDSSPFLEKQLGHEIQFVSTGAEREKFVLKGEWL